MEAQKYVIYINDNPLFLCKSTEVSHLGLKNGKKTLVFPYLGRKKALLNFVDYLEKNEPPAAVVLFCDDVQQLWKHFKKFFKNIEAAGGYVENEEDKVLAMYRRGSWDLPKGKIDKGETPEEAAVREVCEETGVCELELGELLCHTYHTYPHKGKRVLKKTYWYRMRTTQTKLVPQTEEDIELLEWATPFALSRKEEMYESLRVVLEKGKNNEKSI